MIFGEISLWWLFAICPIAYFIGNFNCTRFLCRHIFHDDFTKVGSGNPGATNMLRMHGRKWFFLVFFVDAGKGVLSCLIAFLCYGYTDNVALIAMLAMGLSVVFGTVFPVLYRFRGGKAVSTMVGVGWFINPVILTILFFIFLILILTVRIVSVLSITGISSWVIWAIFDKFFFPVRELQTVSVILYCFFIVIVIFTHHKNLVRIFKWQEHRVSWKK
ncbi:MAG: glycerol-3-phosphate acyltransferase [Christensenellaceae bacterium]|jgi:glycerol-3-phosphate acyltransferase PlsY|nr:glycerol-3-phosphate acyltransferase [Christensenellaceae bacterium]